MQTAPVRSFEYKNAFLSVVIREEPGLGPDAWLCSRYQINFRLMKS